MKQSHWVIASLLCAGLMACQQDVSSPGSELGNPSAMALAGTQQKKVFVANSTQSSLQIMPVSGVSLSELAFERATLPYFARRIYIGGYPTDVVAMNAGKWLAVWDADQQSLRVVNADTYEVLALPDANVKRWVPWEDAGSTAHLMEDAYACEAPCVGRVYALLHTLGKVVSVELTQEGASVAGSVVQVYDFGSPLDHALVAGKYVYGAFASEPRVGRMPLLPGVLETLEAGAVPGVLGVSADANTLVVGRPLWGDVVFITHAQDVWGLQEVRSLGVPDSDCVHVCGQENNCVDVHPSNGAVCSVSTGGVLDTEAVYNGLFLGGVVTSVVALGESVGHPAVVVPCADQEGERRFTQALLVATAEGLVHFVGLQTSSDSAVQPVLMSEGCGAPSLEAQQDVQVLDSCLQVPSASQAYACVQRNAEGVVIKRTALLNQTFQLQWEGVLAGTVRTQGGALADEGRLFGDTFADVTAAGVVQVGDVLQITSQPLQQCTLDPQGGRTGFCALERTITAIEQREGRPWLVLDRPLPVACYPFSGSVAYQIRAGNVFLWSSPRTSSTRVSLGETVGWGLPKGGAETMVFKTHTADPQRAAHACDKYTEEGVPQGSMPASLSRAQTWSFTVKDPYTPVSHSTLFLNSSGATAQVDKSPVGMFVLKGVSDQPAVLVAFSASNSLMGFVPFTASSSALAAASHVVR
jgi:hypothetical protein